MLGEFKRSLRGIHLKCFATMFRQNWILRCNQVPVSAALTSISTPGSTSGQCSLTYHSQMPLYGSSGLSRSCIHLSAMSSLLQVQIFSMRQHLHFLVEVDCSCLRSLTRCRRLSSSFINRSFKACVQSLACTNGV